MRLYQRTGSPFWWLDTTVGGNRYRGSTGETGKREAKKAADRIVDQLEQNLKRAGEVWTISQALGKWYTEHAEIKRSGDAIWSNIGNIERCLDCSTPVDMLTSAMLMDFRAKRRGEPAYRSATTEKAKERAAKLPPRYVQAPTINRDLAYLQAALRHAKLMHLQPVADIPWSKIKYPENEPRNRFASHDEFEAMQSIDDADLADIILAATATGLRRGNMRWTWRQVDLRGKTVTIARTKGRVPIIVRLSAPVVEMLKRRRAAATKGTEVPSPDAEVFDFTNFRRRWERLRKSLGMADFHWHDLRHTFGTWARKCGVDLPTLKEAMAHRDIKTTMRYAQVEADEIATTFDKVGDRMAQSTAHSEGKSWKAS
ncbi:tyrosine-type recombinase/integrase [Sphingopyxis sp. 22461]|uniref:tyrosine-type recombinase/integrase n=1 Tax=Sphingopyxis sp. 22461 TaxID=3453923 RepID=UPI003F84D528